nr:S-ribosylhomocysteine lyase [Campylobacter gracilis]
MAELNKFRCGTFAMHSLAEAKQIAQNVLNKGIGVIKNDKIALDLNLIK